VEFTYLSARWESPCNFIFPSQGSLGKGGLGKKGRRKKKREGMMCEGGWNETKKKKKNIIQRYGITPPPSKHVHP
jgi:hypothetical protein